jgi:hypothetical protein
MRAPMCLCQTLIIHYRVYVNGERVDFARGLLTRVYRAQRSNEPPFGAQLAMAVCATLGTLLCLALLVSVLLVRRLPSHSDRAISNSLSLSPSLSLFTLTLTLTLALTLTHATLTRHPHTPSSHDTRPQLCCHSTSHQPRAHLTSPGASSPLLTSPGRYHV